MSPLQFCKLPFMQNLLTWYFPVLKNCLFKNIASVGAIKENKSKDVSVMWFFAFSLIIKLISWTTQVLEGLFHHFTPGGTLKWPQSCCLGVNLWSNHTQLLCICKSYLLLLRPELIYCGLESCPDVPVRAGRSDGMPSPSYTWGDAGPDSRGDAAVPGSPRDGRRRIRQKGCGVHIQWLEVLDTKGPATPLFFFCISYEKEWDLLSKQERESEGNRWHSGSMGGRD